MTPQVSIVMGVYNDAEGLRDVVESMQKQTLADWELVVVNDGSSDSTGEVLSQLAVDELRIRVIKQENKGLTRALIRGCSEARAPYIARQDADDISHPDRLAKQLSALTSDPEIGFVSCWADYVGPNGEFLETMQRPADSREASARMVEHREGPPAHGTVMFRRDVYEQVGGYRPQFYFGQDADLWLRMIEVSRIAYVPESLYTHRRDPRSITGAMRSIQQKFGVLGHLCREARVSGESEERSLLEAETLSGQVRQLRTTGAGRSADSTDMNYVIGSQLAKNGDARAATYLWPVIKHRPWFAKAWVRLLQSRFVVARTINE